MFEKMGPKTEENTVAKGKYEVIRVAKQLPYITKEDLERMMDPATTENDCYRILKQRRMDWD